MEQLLNEHKLTRELLISCIAKSDKKVADLAYKEKQYRNVGYNNFKLELDNLIQYRQPFFDILKDGYHMTLAEIKSEIAVADVNKIPTKKVIDQIRGMLETWDYTLIQDDCGCVAQNLLFRVATQKMCMIFDFVCFLLEYEIAV